MKLAITGKGGVDTTTLTALLAQTYADPCRAGVLGFLPADLKAQVGIPFYNQVG